MVNEGLSNPVFSGDEECPKRLNEEISREVEIRSMEDVIVAAGTRGWRNYVIYFFCAWASFVSPLHTLSYQFLGATPEYWCKIPAMENNNWTISEIQKFSVPQFDKEKRLESCKMMNYDYEKAAELGFEEASEIADSLLIDDRIIECDARTFDPNEPITVVTMWDLVCERRVIYSTTQATVQAGKLVGSLVMGYFIDLLGRKRILVVSIPLYLVIGLVTAASPNPQIYIFMKFLISTIAMSFYLGGMILAFELCSHSQRPAIGAIFAIPWAIGYMILPGIAYLVRPFPYLQIAATLPVLTTLPCIWILPESPRWLALKGRFDEAIAVLRRIAKYNKRKLPSEEAILRYMKTIHEDVNETKRESALNSLYKLVELLLVPSWLWKMLILLFGWFSASMVYYGVSLNPPDLSQDKYRYIAIGGALEIPSYLLLWPMMKYIGRKGSLVSLFALCALAIYAAAALSYIELESTHPGSVHGWLLFLSLLGKFAITAAFQLIWVYTTELIPTEQRSVVVGESSMFARIGSISSPYIVDLLGESVKWAPSVIFGTFSLVTAVLLAFLPETKNQNLSESIKKPDKN